MADWRDVPDPYGETSMPMWGTLQSIVENPPVHCGVADPGDHDGLIICVSYDDLVAMMLVSYDVFMMIW